MLPVARVLQAPGNGRQDIQAEGGCRSVSSTCRFSSGGLPEAHLPCIRTEQKAAEERLIE